MPYTPSDKTPKGSDFIKPWVFAGGAGLAAIAGYINVIVLEFFSVPVSHMTGAASRIGIDLATNNSDDFQMIFGIVAAFLVGAVISGILVGSQDLLPGRRYGVALVAEGASLAAATGLLLRGQAAGVPLAALACGIQNGMASSYYGLVIRTTHVTGILTDIGVIVGHRLRGQSIEYWKLGLLGLLFGAFVSGGAIGVFAFDYAGASALSLPAAICCLSGGLYFLRHRQSADGGSPS